MTTRARRAAALAGLVPTPVRRIVAHEVRALYALALWTLRRRQVPDGALAVPYTEPQTAMVYGLLFVSVVETVMLALLIPWPLVHRILLVLDVYGIVLVLALHAACVTRPHLVGPDGSLRVRYGVLFDLHVPADAIACARVDRRCPGRGLLCVGPAGELDLSVGGQTTVTVELAEPVPYVRPLGKRGRVRTLRFHADDPRALVLALTRDRAADSVEGPGGRA
ncbi:hypothetical protein [Streptomyces sp. LaPpAH-108]|uniref:hypothetical protein n=1 Tax=Streptomyces sp. LaPpAH-108 TaxID=1155714 RepID=UPI0003659230|nr:hypothetical protein [Streptomyces sp. LaPpAH-108]